MYVFARGGVGGEGGEWMRELGLGFTCGSSQCCVLHDLQFVNAGRGCNRRPYRRGILQSRSHNCFIGSHECLLLFTPSCCSEYFYDL